MHVSPAWTWRLHYDSDRCVAVFIISFVSTVLLSLRHVADIVSWLLHVLTHTGVRLTLTSNKYNQTASQPISIIIIVIIISGVGLSPLGTAATSGLLYKPQMIDEGDCGAIGGMKICRGNRSTRRKPGPAPLCPPQIPHDQTRARTRAAAVGSQRLTAWAMARPTNIKLYSGALYPTS
jgi:hypothetical protein